ncbi:MAG: hypothetical protein HYX75_19100 [Acidobacteria bacterium]|nr:hypothetical protein [Acidobacteriota bacterium]
MTTTMGVKIDAEIRDRLKALGKLKQRSPHWLMCQAIVRYLEEEEAVQRRKKETLERWERYEATGRHVRNDVVMKWLKTWGTRRESKCPNP